MMWRTHRCEPNTLVYCVFRYRRNRPLVEMLLEKLEQSEHPEAVRSWAAISRPLGVPSLFFRRTQRLCAIETRLRRTRTCSSSAA